VRLDEPAWWYGDPAAPSFMARALGPIGDLVAHLAERRFATTAGYRPMVPVICVGNFTAGGTGKTPTTELIVDHLVSKGETPVILSRGYGGRIEGPIRVDPESHGPADVGDEPILLSRAAPVIISADRHAGARFIEQSLKASVIVMDDGLQNPALAKDLSIAIVDAARGFGNGRVLPAGPLRAALPFQLRLVDCIIVNGQDPHQEPPPVFEKLRTTFTGPVMRARSEPHGDVAWLKDAPVLAYAAIANPGRFFRLLEQLGATLAGEIGFRDHRPFTDGDAEALLDRAAHAGAQLVTTEKDMARLAHATGLCARLHGASRALPIRMRLDDRDTTRLHALIDAAVRPPKPAR
jgi:tetraacyldisaccharide 4'-kinase